jgi:putative transposase
MLRLLLIILRGLLSAFRSRRHLLLENLALRQQLAAFLSRGRTPRLRPADRAFWVFLLRYWSRWRDALVFVKPETVVRWHRHGFRRYWSFISRHCRPGRPPAPPEVRELIRQMARDGWGAPRIHGELELLGFDLSERSVSRYLRRLHRRPQARHGWLTFLRNHRDAIAAMDLFVVFTAAFVPLYVFFVIDHGRRRILHLNVTAHPTAEWLIQQLREAFPYDTAPAFLLFDRDSIFSAAVVSTVTAMGTKVVRTAYRAPWQNPTAERWIGSCRRELLDHVIALGEDHLRRLLREYVRYHHDDRTHLGLAKETPAGRSVQPRPSPAANVAALPRLGGLHHRWEWREAA